MVDAVYWLSLGRLAAQAGWQWHGQKLAAAAWAVPYSSYETNELL